MDTTGHKLTHSSSISPDTTTTSKNPKQTGNHPVGLIVFSPELPSGDVQDLLRRLHRHAKHPRHALLSQFLRKSVEVLRQEVQALPRDQRETVPSFADVVTLGSWWETLRRGPVGGAWEGAVVCLYQIAMLIGHYEATGQPYHNQASAGPCLVGISIGLFSAAAVAVSPTLVDLVSRGAEGVRMAFIFCHHVGRVSQLLENTNPHTSKQTDHRIASWASVITGLPSEVVQSELDFFNEQEYMTTPLTKVSISHVDHVSVGVTGPPARLAELFRTSKTLGSSRWAQLPISGGLCHVPNVYNDQDVRSILQVARVSDPQRWGTRSVLQLLISPNTGSPFQATDAAGLIEAICAEALTRPLFFDKLAEGAVTQIQTSLVNPTCTSKTPPSVLHILRYRTSIISDGVVSTVSEQLATDNILAQGQDLVDWVYVESSADEYQANPSLPQDSKLAVVGMACRMPGDADTPEKFWELLVQGRDTVSEVPADRFDLDAHFDPTMEGENTVGTRFGNFVSNPGFFDAGFFNMSPREAQQTDPMQRLALVTAYEALEMAGFVPGRTPSSHPSRVGTYYGQASDDYREVNASQKIGTYGIPGTERAFGNGRINYFFNFQGPSFNVDTACSSGLAAVQAACSALWAGEADTVIAGGLNIITSPDIYCMLGRGHFLSPTGQCKVWDAGADGYCRGDGVGSVVIKRLEDALADNDVVLATILAGATNHSSESISITQPHAGIQKDNYRRVTDRAGISPFDVSYVELHGTGTQVGDAVESESVLDFFAPQGQRRGGPSQRLGLGGVKSNIGHGEAAAGIASLIKVLLMYRHNMIPRHIGIKTTINPVVARHLAGRNAGIISENTAWSGPSNRNRYSIVNSFGAHGGNTTLLLEDAPPQFEGVVDEDLAGDGCQEVVCISAKSKASLRGNVAGLLAYLEANPNTRLQDVAYTTSARRIHHHIRVAEAVSSTSALRQVLQTMTANDANLDAHAFHVPKQRKKVVFAFSGQGCFYRGAAASLCERAPDFGDLIFQLDRIVIQLGFPSVRALLVGPTTNEESDSPLVTQLAMVVLQIALSRYWALLGIVPDAVIGHSLGEYAALCTAGVLSAADTLFLVGHRAQLTASACGETGSHSMLSIRGASASELVDRYPPAQFGYEVSCINGRTDVVVSGPKARLDSLRSTSQKQAPELKCVLLDVPYAFHSAQLDPILDDFETAARQRVTFKTPEIPVISPFLGEILPASKDSAAILDATYLPRATRRCVDFVSAVGDAAAAGFADDTSVWLDIGPHPVCSNFVRNCLDTGKEAPAVTTLPSLRKSDDILAAWSYTLAALHRLGLPVAWEEYFSRRRGYSSSQKPRLLHLETYRWNNKNYWIPYDTTWTLDKADPIGSGLQKTKQSGFSSEESSFFTSSVQRVSFEDVSDKIVKLTALSDLWHPDMLGAAAGHKIHGRSVLTASIWADICLTVGEHVYKRLLPHTTNVFMDVRDMQVVEAQLIDDHGPSPSQFIRIEAELDLDQGRTQVALWSAHSDGSPKSDRAFATAVVWYYPDSQEWQSEWQTASHLVGSRIDTLWESTTSSTGKVSALSRQATYQLFANVVDYDIRYQGMRRAALDSDALEAAADIVLDADRHGTWHTPPHWIDGTFQLAGLVMNSFGDAKAGSPARDFFFITPGWRRLRLTEALEAGIQYRNYVCMVPVEGEPGAYTGDIYLLRDKAVVGLCQGIKFKRVPRGLMPVMFARRGNNGSGGNGGANKTKKQVGGAVAVKKSAPRDDQMFAVPRVTPHAQPPVQNLHEGTPRTSRTTSEAEFIMITPPSEPSAAVLGPGTTKAEAGDHHQTHHPHIVNSMRLIAQETGLDAEDLRPETTFADVGVDSLMSLTLADKLQAELGVPVKASLFLECPTVGDLEKWLMKQG